MPASKMKTKPKIKAILLDIDNTLIPTSKFSKTARDSAINALFLEGLNVKRSIAVNKLNKVISKYGSNYSSHFDVLLEELKTPKRLLNKLVARATGAYHDAKKNTATIS